MSTGVLFKIILAALGLTAFVRTIYALAKKKLTDSLSLLWFVLSACLFLAGIVVKSDVITQYVGMSSLVLFTAVLIGGLVLVWLMSIHIATLTRKNLELAIQISLLNAEITQIHKVLQDLTGKSSDELWRQS